MSCHHGIHHSTVFQIHIANQISDLRIIGTADRFSVSPTYLYVLTFYGRQWCPSGFWGVGRGNRGKGVDKTENQTDKMDLLYTYYTSPKMAEWVADVCFGEFPMLAWGIKTTTVGFFCVCVCVFFAATFISVTQFSIRTILFTPPQTPPPSSLWCCWATKEVFN
jgi:hypothetical protein